jgi:hypothetical protein
MERNDVNIASLTHKILDRLNESLEKRNIKKFFDVKISKGTTPLDVSSTIVNEKKGGKITKTAPTRTIKLVAVDLQTNERIVLYETTYRPSHPAELMNKVYITKLYSELFAQCLIFTSINIESITVKNKAEREAKEASKRAEENAKAIGVVIDKKPVLEQ